jgi:3-oxo-5-alpha-steroid 4-dehydrogenase 3
MDPATLFRSFFGLGTVIDIGGTLIPSFRENVMNYGPRQMNPSKNRIQKPGTFMRFLRCIASFQVPHTWFTHYYIVSVASSIFWAFQLYTRGTAYHLMVSYSKERSTSMTGNQIFLAWLMMTLQGTRRLYESATLSKPSQSKMWAGLWAIGIAYYVFMGMSVWIEGIRE